MAYGRKVAGGVRAMVVRARSGSRRRRSAKVSNRIFTDAGFEWRNPGCSMCLGMNETSSGPASAVRHINRNFEGRQAGRAKPPGQPGHGGGGGGGGVSGRRPELYAGVRAGYAALLTDMLSHVELDNSINR